MKTRICLPIGIVWCCLLISACGDDATTGPDAGTTIDTGLPEPDASARPDARRSYDGGPDPATVLAEIEAMAPGEWYEIPDSSMDIQGVEPGPEVWTAPSPGGWANLIDAWNSGAYDHKRQRLMLWGGGHSDYAGNEVYAFDLNTFRWSRLTDPYDWVGNGDELNSNDEVWIDGAPVSMHSNDGLVYMPDPVDKFVVMPSASGVWYTANGGLGRPALFDLTDHSWTMAPPPPNPSGLAEAGITGVDANGHAWFHGRGFSYLQKFDGVGWTEYGANANWDLGMSGAIDTTRNLLVGLGDGQAIHVYDLASPNTPPQQLPGMGTARDEFLSQSYPGLAFRSIDDNFYGYVGGNAVYRVTPTNFEVTKIEPSNAVDPGAEAAHGTLDRWAYLPHLDRFAIVNSVYRSVYLWRP